MAYGQRKSPRVEFEHGMKTHIMGIDKTWRRPCVIHDISQTGARLTIKGSIENLNVTEFFLILSPTASVYRRCHLVRAMGEQIGVVFQKQPGASSFAQTG